MNQAPKALWPIRPTILTIAVVAGLVLGTHPLLAQDVLDLPVGDVARRDKTVALLLDGVVDTVDGAVLTPAETAERLADTRLVLVGESHTAMDIHRAQLQVVRALIEAGRTVLIGLEMFPVTEQESLDWWINEQPHEDDFVRRARWYQHWGYNWGYYRDIFLLAQRHSVPMYAINAPRSAVTAVRTDGYENLPAEQQRLLPPDIDTDSPDHLLLFKSYFPDATDDTHGGMTDEQWQSMFAAQVTWDAAMAWHAVRALEEHAEADPVMVVLVGSGHVAYNLGIARQAARFFDGAVRTIIPVAMTDDSGMPVTTIRASYADFVWGVPGEHEPLFPSLGVSLRESDAGGLAILFANEGGAGERVGLSSGDRVLRLDGEELTDRETFNRLIGAKRWGDSAVLRVDSDGQERDVIVTFRRERGAER